MGALRSLLNALLGVLVRAGGRTQVGAGSRVRWWGLRARGGNRIRVGSGCIVNCRVDFDGDQGVVTIGDRAYLGKSQLVCRSGITIGDDVIMSWGVTVVDHDSHPLDWQQRSRDVADWMRGTKDWSHVTVKPVRIDAKAWIGFGATILKGVHVGEGAVIGAQAVVTRDVPPFAVVAGNPAKVVKSLEQQPVIA